MFMIILYFLIGLAVAIYTTMQRTQGIGGRPEQWDIKNTPGAGDMRRHYDSHGSYSDTSLFEDEDDDFNAGIRMGTPDSHEGFNISHGSLGTAYMNDMNDPPKMMSMNAYGSGMHEFGSADLSSPYDNVSFMDDGFGMNSDFGMDKDFDMDMDMDYDMDSSHMMSCDAFGSGMHEFGAPDMSCSFDSGFNNMC